MPKKPRLATALVAALLLAPATAIADPFPDDPPNDPLYAPSACAPVPQEQDCGGPNGQWNLFSFDPTTQEQANPAARPSGISASEAWNTTTGGPETVVAILDSGVNYDHEDLRNKIWLNRGELPVPDGAACAPPPGDPHDCDGDGVFSILDYTGDSRVDPAANGSAALERGDLRFAPGFVDGVDDDRNGYVDDLSGWDTDDDDGDEFDHRYFGHGTGRAGILAPETNNGVGVAGVCPDCPLMNVRIDDTFVHHSEGVAKGAIYAVDNGASVINMSLGATTASDLSRGAFDYATANNVLAVNASANEFSFHQNFQSVFDDVMTIGGVTANNRRLSTTFLQKASFANYGAHLDVVAPTEVPGASMARTGTLPNNAAYTQTASGTSSATPHAAGVAALVYSRARELIGDGTLDVSGLALQDISAQEVRQILNGTADDVTPSDMTDYAVSSGWDKWTGYGRVNADASLERVAPGTIPPEADINAPDWYSLVDGVVRVEAYANARWTDEFDFVLEFGAGVEPSAWTTIAASTSRVRSNPALSSASRVSTLRPRWDTSDLEEGLHTLRLTVTDDLSNTAEDRMAVWVREPDADDLPGFPVKVDGSLESLSVSLVDIDADNKAEIITAGGNGEVHAIRHDGTEVPGFPVHTDPPRHLPLTTSPAFDGEAANGEVKLSYSSVVGGTAVADADQDGFQEIFVAASDGKAYCWNHDGSVCHGWPAAADDGTSRDPYAPHAQLQNDNPDPFGATPALGNLDADPQLEIVVGNADQKLYVWNHDGSRVAGWPIELFDDGSASGRSEFAPRAIIASAAIADLDDDGATEIVIPTNEVYATPNEAGVGGSGRIYALEADGSIIDGWPAKPTSVSPSAVPLVAEGVGTSPIVADLDDDDALEVISTVFLGDATVWDSDGSMIRELPAPGGAGLGSDDDETTPEGGIPGDPAGLYYVAQGAVGQFDATPGLDYFTGTVGSGIGMFALGDAGVPVEFDHLLSGWDAETGVPKPAFPRTIEDWQFFIGPAIAEIDGDAMPEVIQSSGGFYVHAFDALGLEPTGWPKLTGQWQVASPSVGDLDGDGDMEVVQTTRMGEVFAWTTGGDACQDLEWPKFRHDAWNTGTYGTDTLPPGAVTDASVSTDGSRIHLTFSAVGDDGLCGGPADRYEVQFGGGGSTLARATSFDLPDPGAPGQEETIEIPADTSAVGIRLRAVDAAGNSGPWARVPLCRGPGRARCNGGKVRDGVGGCECRLR